MIYESKQKAKDAAEKFALEKLREGKHASYYKEGDSFFVNHYGSPWTESGLERFKFRTLKKGDLCWCWDDINEGSKTIKVFTGKYVDGIPHFSSHQHLGSSGRWDNYEPIGINIFDKVTK